MSVANHSTIERLVPDEVQPDDITGMATLALHRQRYEFAVDFLRPGIALDIACGVGYGTHMMALRSPPGRVSMALGIDNFPEAISYANEHFAGDRVRFLCADAMEFSDLAGFDSIVSLETIEHLPDPEGFVARIVPLLKTSGILVASVPTTPSVDANPHHIHDFTERSFRGLFTRHGLVEVVALRQIQPFSPSATITRAETRMKDMRANLPAYYVAHPTALFKAGGVWRA